MNNPVTPKGASGRFVLRISPALHTLLRRAAEENGVSLNDYCARKLAAPGATLTAVPWALPVVERAAELFAADLVGVAVFGSWARGAAVDQSDIDLLVVLETSVPLTRRLYQRWDETPLVWNGHRLEPQFVHLPDPQETVAGLWAEVALDGIVLFESDLRLSTRLVRVRRDIVSGRIARRTAHGQPYWVENEVA